VELTNLLILLPFHRYDVHDLFPILALLLFRSNNARAKRFLAAPVYEALSIPVVFWTVARAIANLSVVQLSCFRLTPVDLLWRFASRAHGPGAAPNVPALAAGCQGNPN